MNDASIRCLSVAGASDDQLFAPSSSSSTSVNGPPESPIADLFRALRKGELNVVTKMLEANPDLWNATDEGMHSLLHWADRLKLHTTSK